MGCTGSKGKEGQRPVKDEAFFAEIARKLPTGKDASSKAKRDELFSQLDNDNSGTLTLAECTKGIQNIIGAEHDVKPAVNRAFRYAKASGTEKGGKADKTVDRSEFRRLVIMTSLHFRIRAAFEETDRNADRRLARNEIDPLFKRLNEWGAGIKDFDKAFDEIDEDGTGDCTYREISCWALQQKFPGLGLGDDNGEE